MSYRTQFQGQFLFDKPVTVEVIKEIYNLEYVPEVSSSYCYWTLNDDFNGIICSESMEDSAFYNYVEYLQYIIDKILLPRGITLIGEMIYRGADLDDTGYLYISNNKVLQYGIKDMKKVIFLK